VCRGEPVKPIVALWLD